jgi:hypothetical protein
MRRLLVVGMCVMVLAYATAACPIQVQIVEGIRTSSASTQVEEDGQSSCGTPRCRDPVEPFVTLLATFFAIDVLRCCAI